MDIYVDFFVDNWLWFLVSGIVLLMTLIGYIAEKTDFGRKEVEKKVKPKKEKKNKKEKKEQVTEVEKQEVEPEVQISLATPIEEQPKEEVTMEDIPEELKVPFGDVTFDNITDTNVETLMPTLEETESSGVEELKMDIPTPELPDLNSVVEDTDTDNDDVWKF